MGKDGPTDGSQAAGRTGLVGWMTGLAGLMDGRIDYCNKKLLGAPGLTTRSKDATRVSPSL